MKASTPERPWPPNAVPQLPEPLGYDKLLPMMDEAGVERVVIVPPGWEGIRNDYATGGARATSRPSRLHGPGLRLTDPRSATFLRHWKEQAGMLGIRVTFNRGEARGHSGMAASTGCGRWSRRSAFR